MYAAAIPQDVANDAQNSGIQIVFGPDGKLTDKNAMNMQAKPSPTPVASITPPPARCLPGRAPIADCDAAADAERECNTGSCAECDGNAESDAAVKVRIWGRHNLAS